MEKEVVCVTGGAGFLGQHIVKTLQEKADFVKEIRILDVRPYINHLGNSETKPITSVVCDLCSHEDVRKAFDGVDSVIHSGGLVSYGAVPDNKGMERVNVDGTGNVIEACVEKNVKQLVFTSSLDVIVGFEDFIDGDETLEPPSKLVMKGYAETKYRSERMVLQANGRKLADATQTLATIAVRPIPMYGEGDPHGYTHTMKTASKTCGKLIRFGRGNAIMQHAYVGNVAWGHVTALDSIRKDPVNSAGQVYFLTDDSPQLNLFDFMKPFLKAKGYSVSSCYIPYPLVYVSVFIMEKVLWLLSPLYKSKSPVSVAGITHVNKTHTVSSAKAREKLGYDPLYDWNQSFENSVDYYTNLV